MTTTDPPRVYRGPLPDIDVPDCTLYELLFAGLTGEDAAKTAVVDDASGVRLTFGQVRAQVDAAASWLAARGIGPGDVAAVFLPNGPDYLAAFHGIARSGAAATPINAGYTAHEVARKMIAMEAEPSWTKLPGVVLAALRG